MLDPAADRLYILATLVGLVVRGIVPFWLAALVVGRDLVLAGALGYAALAQMAPAARRIEAPSTDKGAALPAHPGTAAYIDDEESSFFDSYSDYIYIGAMGLGVLASGMTAILGRFSISGAERVEDLVARLLDVFKRVRTAPSATALDELDGHVDEVITHALDQRSLRNLDERRAAALNLAVEQVRSAIRDQRKVLRDRGAADRARAGSALPAPEA